MPRHQTQCQVWLGPLRGEAPLPVVDPGQDVTLGAGWTEVTSLVSGHEGVVDGHQATVRLTLAGWAMDTATWTPDRQIVIRARHWSDSLGTFGPWAVAFAGYVTGEGSGQTSGSERGPQRRGSIVCKQDWHYVGLSRVPALTFGLDELARGAAAVASSVLGSPMAEAPLEFVSAVDVGANQAVDGNRDTLWIAATTTDSAPPPVLHTAKTLRVRQLYDGTGGVGVIGTNGRPRAIELWCADVVYAEGFETGTGGWVATAGATITRTGGWAASGAWSLVVTGPGGSVCPVGGGAEVTAGGMSPEIEAAVSFTLKGDTGPATVDILVGGGAGQGAVEVFRVTVTSDRPQRLRYYKPAGRTGTLSLRFKWVAGTKGFFVDDVRFSGGVDLEQSDNKGLFLAWEDGRGASGHARLSSLLGVDRLGGERAWILTDDTELFRSQFDSPDATINQWRLVPGLEGLDFASGRGRLRLALYRRWPDLVGAGGTIWDDVQLGSLPGFTSLQAVRRTAITPATWQAVSNPAFGGGATTGAALLRVPLPPFPAAIVQAPVPGSGSPVTVTVDSTARFPVWGNAYIDDELVWLNKTSPTEFVAYRTVPVAHSAGAPILPQQDGAKVVAALVAAIGLRRRAGTPVIEDFQLIGSLLTTPRDPSVPDPGGGTYGDHDDWVPLVTGRGNRERNLTYLIGRHGDWASTGDVPAIGTTATWGRPLRWVGLVIDRMSDGGRAKLNELLVWAADLASGVSGQWQGTNPADLRGVVAHLLTQHAGIPPSQIQLDRGGGISNLPWGAFYGELAVAPGTVDRAIASLEERGLLRVTTTPTGRIRIIADPLTTAAAFALPEQTWTDATIWSLDHRRAPAHRTAQARVTARNEATQATFRSAFPRTPTRLGEIADIADVLLGTQAQTDDHAIRAFRQRNVPWQLTIQTGYVSPLSVWARHIVTSAAGDRSGETFAGHNGYVERYSWTCQMTRRGAIWRTSIELASLEPWG